jgi:hypothetical protein
MMNIIAELQKDLFTPRFYVAALTDSMSLQKAQVYEQSLIQVVIYHAVLRYAWSLLSYLEHDSSCALAGWWREDQWECPFLADIPQSWSRAILHYFHRNNIGCYIACYVDSNKNQTTSGVYPLHITLHLLSGMGSKILKRLLYVLPDILQWSRGMHSSVRLGFRS